MYKMKQLVNHIIGDNDDQHMDVDQNFTERVLSEMPSIDRETIDVLIDNGYQDKDALMAFDIKEDLPMLPVLNMAQKSLLRKALIAIQESEEFEFKVSDLKADDYVGSQQPTVTTDNKRKRETTPRVSTTPVKRTRTSGMSVISSNPRPPSSSIASDGLGSRMRQVVSGRKSIRGGDMSDSDIELNNSRRITRTYVSSPEYDINNVKEEEEEDEEEEEVNESDEEEEEKVNIDFRHFGSKTTARKSIGGPTPRFMLANRPTMPIGTTQFKTSARKSIATPRPSQVPVLANSVTDRRSLALNRLSTVTKTPDTSPNTRRSSSTYVPTPTELEVRERLEQKKLEKATTKSGRKTRAKR